MIIIPLFRVSLPKNAIIHSFPVHTVIVRWLCDIDGERLVGEIFNFLLFKLPRPKSVYKVLMYIVKRDEEERNHKSTFFLLFIFRSRLRQYNQSGENRRKKGRNCIKELFLEKPCLIDLAWSKNYDVYLSILSLYMHVNFDACSHSFYVNIQKQFNI